MQRISSPQITTQPSAIEIVARQHAARGAMRWMFLRNLAFRGQLEAFVAIHQLDWMGGFEKIEQAVDKAIAEGWK